MPRSTPSLDMTPLVDLAFLLVTFFILTSSFRQPEPVIVDTPKSTNDSIIPKQVFLITVASDGRTFIDITNPKIKATVFEAMCKKYKITVSKEEVAKFAGTSSIGMKMGNILEYLALEPAQRNSVEQRGIPYDTLGDKKSELYWWATNARIAAQNDFNERKEEAETRKLPFDPRTRLRFAVKADGKAKYDAVKNVIQIFRDVKIKEFEMITGLEDKPQ